MAVISDKGYLICNIVWLSWFSTSSALELAWKFRCAEIKSINSVVRLTLACSSADELMEPKVPEPASPASASPEEILSAIQSQVKETQALKEAIAGNDESTLFGLLKFKKWT